MAAPVVIVHTTDLHFGKRMAKISQDGENVREHDIYRAGQTVASYIADVIKPDVVVDAGDRWDVPRPGTRALSAGYSFQETLRGAGIPVVVVGGNHDTLSQPGRPTPLEHLKNHFDAHLALEQTEIDVAGIRFCCIPYRTMSLGELRDPHYASDVPNVLVVHGTVDAGDLPDFAKYDHTRLPNDTLTDPRSCLRLLGHIHIHQQVDDHAYYAGAVERLTWGEINNDPAIYVHRVHPDGRVETESVRVADMGVVGVPRPAHNLFVACDGLTAEEIVDKAHATLEEHTLDEHLVQLTFNDATRDLYGVHYEDTLTRRALQRGALTLNLRVRAADEAALEIQTPEHAAHDPMPGQALCDQFRAFAAQRGEDEELAKLGQEIIAAVSGEELG